MHLFPAFRAIFARSAPRHRGGSSWMPGPGSGLRTLRAVLLDRDLGRRRSRLGGLFGNPASNQYPNLSAGITSPLVIPGDAASIPRSRVEPGPGRRSRRSCSKIRTGSGPGAPCSGLGWSAYRRRCAGWDTTAGRSDRVLDRIAPRHATDRRTGEMPMGRYQGPATTIPISAMDGESFAGR